MQTFIDVVRPALAFGAGAVIGSSFGLLQSAARRWNQKGRLRGDSGFTVWSGLRLAYLLICLVVVQVVCPMLFAAGTQWWVSGGLAAGYGWILFRQIQERAAPPLKVRLTAGKRAGRRR